MMEYITFGYIVQVLCTAIGFFTFIKLLSSDVYLKYHRLLPTVAAIITINDFYLIIIPFVKAQAAIDVLYLLCDMCAMVIMFMLYFYMCFLKKISYFKVPVAVGTTLMILICIVDFVYFRIGKDKPINTDLVAVFIIVIGCIFVAVSKSNAVNYFDKQDKYISRVMMLSFALAFGGYMLKALFPTFNTIPAVGYAIDCVIYYWMADKNRIEDTATILSGRLFDLFEYPVAFVNKDFYIIDSNRAGYKTFPYGEGIEFAFEDGDYQNKFLLAQRMVEHEENDKEIFADDKWYRVHWTQIDGKNGVKGYVFSTADVTDQHEEMIQAKNETAEKSMFLAHMSHELRSPLHAIIGVSDILLSKHDISTKNRGLVQHIKKASDGLLDLVDAILDFSKLEAGKFSFTEKRYNVDEMFEELTYHNVINLGSKPVDFTININSDYPKYLYGDAMRVREIFQNLFSNAVKFTESGRIKTDIVFEQSDEDKVHIMFTVEDTGHGMSEELIKEVFSEYVSMADNVTIEGTGLGLSITRQIITLLGGNITVESDGVSGSKFTCDFYQKVDDTEYLTEHVYNRRTATQQHNITNEGIRPEWIYPEAKILITDDMRINQEILKQLLGPWKCQIDCVSDGMSAIEAVKNKDYQLIFLDQMMTPITGLETSVEIKKYSNAPIVLITANTEDNAASIIADYGLAEYLGKPVHMPDIHRVMDTLIPQEFRKHDVMDPEGSIPRRDLKNLVIYQKTLETFIKEMEPLILHLPGYSKNDHELFKVKVHGIKGVSRQIGREEFSEQAEVMEMAAKAEHWAFVERHMDQFLTSLCDVVEEATAELTLLAPDLDSQKRLVEEESVKEKIDVKQVNEMFAKLLDAFDDFDIARIEEGINALKTLKLNKEAARILKLATEAYEELEYETGSEVIEQYLEKQKK